MSRNIAKAQWKKDMKIFVIGESSDGKNNFE